MDFTMFLTITGAFTVSWVLMKFVLWLDGER